MKNFSALFVNDNLGSLVLNAVSMLILRWTYSGHYLKNFKKKLNHEILIYKIGWNHKKIVLSENRKK
jgi:hypothetical protein